MTKQLKILYISPQHVSGTMDLWQAEHRRRGNECRYVTLFPSAYGFKEDISLNLPLHPDKGFIVKTRRLHNKLRFGTLGDDTPLLEKPPFRPPYSPVEKIFFAWRDSLISARVEEAIKKYNLDSFDIIHFDQGQGFFRDGRVVRRWHNDGKKLVAFYHGSDMRNRGIFRNIDELIQLRLTSEVDLMYLDDRLEYLFLPFDTSMFTPIKKKNGGKLKIVHAARVRSFKGTDKIVEVVRKLEKRYPVELVLIENVPHDEAMRLKTQCDIAIDQIADTGGWGYGMSSVEYLSMGIPTCTSMVPEMEEFLPDHPFISVTEDTLESKLIELIESEDFRRGKSEYSRDWVVKYHDVKAAGDKLYNYYEREEWV
ncbi:hypothetical protein ACFLQJ_01670 [Calditrichota bacterium]